MYVAETLDSVTTRSTCGNNQRIKTTDTAWSLLSCNRKYFLKSCAVERVSWRTLQSDFFLVLCLSKKNGKLTEQVSSLTSKVLSITVKRGNNEHFPTSNSCPEETI